MSVRGPAVVIPVINEKTAAEHDPYDCLPIISMQKEHFASVHGHLHPETPITESSLPIQQVVQSYQVRLRDIEERYLAQKARQDRLERALAEANAMLREHSTALAQIKERVGIQ